MRMGLNGYSSLVVYHNDADGFTAAWIVAKAFSSVELLAVQYGDLPPEVAGRDVIILDFSWPRDVLLDMHSKAKSLLVLDHHKTARAALEGLDFCRFDMDESGATLAWMYIHGRRPPPLLVQYVKDRDLWKFALPDSRVISEAIGTYPFELSVWDQLDCRIATDDGFAGLAMEGVAIRRAQAQCIARALSRATVLTLAGVLFTVVNSSDNISELGHQLAGKTGASACWFQANAGLFVWSLRSAADGPDVSFVARVYGGGGHRGAAGFRVGVEQHIELLHLMRDATPCYTASR